MVYYIFDFIFNTFDAVLATLFFLKFNGYEIKEKPLFLSLIPLLLLITQISGGIFDIFEVALGILISFLMMYVMKINNTAKLRCLWSSILFYGTLMLVNSIVYHIFQTYMDISIIYLIERSDIYVAVCIISKSILLLTIAIYLFINERLEYRNHNVDILNPLFISGFNIIFIIVIMQITAIEISRYMTLVMTGVFFSGIIHYYMYAKLSSKAKVELNYERLEQKNAYDKKMYSERKEQFENIMQVKHGIKNHLMKIAYYINNEDYEHALAYLDNIDKRIGFVRNEVVIFNDTINFIINYKIDEARRKNINVSVHIEDVKNCIVEEFDLCELLGNLLDNAIEREEIEEDKHIKIEIYDYAGYQVYFIKNRIEKSVLTINPELLSSKTDKRNHGYGMRQIHNIVDKYQGHLDIYEQDGYFNVKVLLPKVTDKNVNKWKEKAIDT